MVEGVVEDANSWERSASTSCICSASAALLSRASEIP